MPMIDVYAPAGTFPDPTALAREAAAIVMRVERVPDIAMFRENTVAFVHEMPPGTIAHVDGAVSGVRVQVLTNAGALDRGQQLDIVSELSAMIARTAGDARLSERTWVLLTEATPGGWGLWGHAHTNDELVVAARERLSSGG